MLVIRCLNYIMYKPALQATNVFLKLFTNQKHSALFHTFHHFFHTFYEYIFMHNMKTTKSTRVVEFKCWWDRIFQFIGISPTNSNTWNLFNPTWKTGKPDRRSMWLAIWFMQITINTNVNTPKMLKLKTFFMKCIIIL